MVLIESAPVALVVRRNAPRIRAPRAPRFVRRCLPPLVAVVPARSASLRSRAFAPATRLRASPLGYRRAMRSPLWYVPVSLFLVERRGGAWFSPSLRPLNVRYAHLTRTALLARIPAPPRRKKCEGTERHASQAPRQSREKIFFEFT